MGAWGPGPFDSDDGLELAAIVEHSEFSAVRKRLKFDRDDEADCAHAYAAAAIVAASQGHRVAEFPLELDKPLAKFRKACQRAHVDQAINALETIKKDSALKQLWKESPSGTRPLTTEVNKLLKLLNSKPRALPPPPPRPKRRKITAGG